MNELAHDTIDGNLPDEVGLDPCAWDDLGATQVEPPRDDADDELASETQTQVDLKAVDAR